MSSDFYRRQGQQHQQEIVRFQREKSRETDRIADLSRKINTASQAASRSNSISIAASKRQEVARYQEETARTQKKSPISRTRSHASRRG